jgi:hypothetical protein
VSAQAWIVDIDGTLALKGDRSPYDWARVGEDKPNAPVIAVVQALICRGYEIRYLSGRMEQCRDATIDWLREHVASASLPTDLLMRPDNDFRPDEVLKRELYEAHIKGRYEVMGVIDDRAKVVRMWRDEVGLICLQVAPGEF